MFTVRVRGRVVTGVVVAFFPLYVAHGDPPAPADRAACQSGDGAACYRLGAGATAAGDLATAVDFYTRACDAGRGLACVHLGRGVDPDAKRRPTWLRKSVAAFAKACAAKEAESC